MKILFFLLNLFISEKIEFNIEEILKKINQPANFPIAPKELKSSYSGIELP